MSLLLRIFPAMNPRKIPQSTDIQAAAIWGGTAGTAALWIVQPFGWLKKTFFEKPEPEGNK